MAWRLRTTCMCQLRLRWKPDSVVLWRPGRTGKTVTLSTMPCNSDSPCDTSRDSWCWKRLRDSPFCCLHRTTVRALWRVTVAGLPCQHIGANPITPPGEMHCLLVQLGFTVDPSGIPGFGLHKLQPHPYYLEYLGFGSAADHRLDEQTPVVKIARLSSARRQVHGLATRPSISGQRSRIRPRTTLAKIHGATDLFRSIAELAHVCILTHLPPIRRRDSSLGQPGQPHACSGIVLVIWTEHACDLVSYSWIVLSSLCVS